MIDDAKISYKWRNDPEVWKYTGSKPNRNITPEIEKEWLTSKLLEKDSHRFAIIVDDQYVGNIQLTNVIASDVAEYHIFIGEKYYWGKGIARLASLQIIRYAKVSLFLKKIFLIVHPDNLHAIKLYESCGFKKVDLQVKMVLQLIESLAPKVSVYMITYNHEKYIREALTGVLNQKTRFDFEIIVGDDGSTDNAREIIQDIATKWPGKFNLQLHEKNIGAFANQMSVLNKCNGKYIAICEGDDYWIDPKKLQLQVDFLDQNLEYSFCFHQAIRLNEPESVYDIYPINNLKSFDSVAFFSMHTIPVASIVFRNLFSYDFMMNHTHCDFQLLCHLMSRGKSYFFHEVMSVYRVHPNGVSFNHSSLNYVNKRLKELEIEWELPVLSQEVRNQVARIYMQHVIYKFDTYKQDISRFEIVKYMSQFRKMKGPDTDFKLFFSKLLKHLVS